MLTYSQYLLLNITLLKRDLPLTNPRKCKQYTTHATIRIRSLKISSHIMSYLAPKDLLNAADCNKLMKNNLTMKMVVQSVLNTGGTAMASMMALYTHMLSKAIHSMTPYRMLDVCIGTLCEYCQYVTDEPMTVKKH